MARPLFAIAVVCVVGLAALRFLFGLISAASFLFGLLVKIALVAGLVYLTLTVFAPETARRLREQWLGKA